MDQTQNQGTDVNNVAGQPTQEASPQVDSAQQQAADNTGSSDSSNQALATDNKTSDTTGQAPADDKSAKQSNKIEIDLDSDLDDETAKKLLGKFSKEKLYEEMHARFKESSEEEKNKVFSDQVKKYGEQFMPDKKEFDKFVKSDSKKFYEADMKLYDSILDQAGITSKLDKNGNLTQQSLAVILPHLITAKATAQRFNAQDKMPIDNTQSKKTHEELLEQAKKLQNPKDVIKLMEGLVKIV